MNVMQESIEKNEIVLAKFREKYPNLKTEMHSGWSFRVALTPSHTHMSILNPPDALDAYAVLLAYTEANPDGYERKYDSWYSLEKDIDQILDMDLEYRSSVKSVKNSIEDVRSGLDQVDEADGFVKMDVGDAENDNNKENK